MKTKLEYIYIGLTFFKFEINIIMCYNNIQICNI
jgi:hypothetical protein